MIATEVTALVEATQALAEAEQRERLVLAHTADPIVQYAGDGTVMWASPALERMLGWGPDDVVGTRLRLNVAGEVDTGRAAVLDAVEAAGRAPDWASPSSTSRCGSLTAMARCAG